MSALLIVVGSLCSNNDALAIAGMAVAAFVVLFARRAEPDRRARQHLTCCWRSCCR